MNECIGNEFLGGDEKDFRAFALGPENKTTYAPILARLSFELLLRLKKQIGTRVMALRINDDSPKYERTRELLRSLDARPNYKAGGKDTWTQEKYWPKA